MHLVAAFVILLTFVPGPGRPDYRSITCKDQACVEEVLKHAPESRYLTRLRVFPADEYGGTMTFGRLTAFPALQDLTFD